MIKNIKNYNDEIKEIPPFDNIDIKLKDGSSTNLLDYAERFYTKDGNFIYSKSNIEAICGEGATYNNAVEEIHAFEKPFSDKLTNVFYTDYLPGKKEYVFDYLVDSLSTFFTLSSITFSQVFFLCLFLIFIGLFGIIFSRLNILIVLMSIEMVLLGVSLLFILFSVFLQNADGQIFSLILLTVAAAEAAAGLAILVLHNRLTKTIMLDNITNLRG